MAVVVFGVGMWTNSIVPTQHLVSLGLIPGVALVGNSIAILYIHSH